MEAVIGGYSARELSIGGLAFLCFCIGWLNLSSFWAVCAAALAVFLANIPMRQKTEDEQIDSELKKEGSHLRLLRPLRLNDLDARDRPQWLVSQDHDRVRWLNMVLQGAWVNVGDAYEPMLRDMLSGMLKPVSSMVGPLARFIPGVSASDIRMRCDVVSFGRSAPQFTSARGRPVDEATGVQVDAELDWWPGAVPEHFPPRAATAPDDEEDHDESGSKSTAAERAERRELERMRQEAHRVGLVVAISAHVGRVRLLAVRAVVKNLRAIVRLSFEGPQPTAPFFGSLGISIVGTPGVDYDISAWESLHPLDLWFARDLLDGVIRNQISNLQEPARISIPLAGSDAADETVR